MPLNQSSVSKTRSGIAKKEIRYVLQQQIRDCASRLRSMAHLYLQLNDRQRSAEAGVPGKPIGLPGSVLKFPPNLTRDLLHVTCSTAEVSGSEITQDFRLVSRLIEERL